MVRGWLGVGILIVFLVAGFVTAGVMDNAHIPTEQLLAQAAEKTDHGRKFESHCLFEITHCLFEISKIQTTMRKHSEA